MAELKTNTKIGVTTIAEGGAVSVTLPAFVGTLAVGTPETVTTDINKSVALLLDHSGNPVLKRLTAVWSGSAWITDWSYGLGDHALDNSSGDDNIGIGSSSLHDNTGNSNIGIGTGTLRYNEGSYNDAVGYHTLRYNTGGYNVGMGFSALEYNTGGECVGIGDESLRHNEGSYNTGIGAYANNMFLEDHVRNITIDATAVNITEQTITAVAHGVGVGQRILLKYTATTGTAIGGLTASDSIYDSNVYLFNYFGTDTLKVDLPTIITSQGTGTHTFTPQTVYTNTTCLGSNTVPTASNQVVLGNSSVTSLKVGNTAITVPAGVSSFSFPSDATGGVVALGGVEQEVVGRNLYVPLINRPDGVTILRTDTQVQGWMPDNSVGLGVDAIKNNAGAGSIGIGPEAMRDNLGSYSIGIGNQALMTNMGENNVGVGAGALNNNTGYFGVGIGDYALSENAGNSNTAIGYIANSTFLPNTAGNKTCNATDVNTSLSQITLTGHGFGANSSFVRLKYASTTGTAINYLALGAIYLAKIIDANTISFSEEGNERFTLYSQGTGTHTFTPQFVYDNTTCLGSNTVPTASNQVVLGDTAVTSLKVGSVDLDVASLADIVTWADTATGELTDIPAVQISVADSSSYFTGTNVETALQELGARVYIIESSSNADGSYIKYSDGVMTCSKIVSYSGGVAISNAQNNSYYSAAQTITFPIEFYAIPVIVPIIRITSYLQFGVFINLHTLATATWNVVFNCDYSLTFTGDVHYQAVGRWKA
jgi:hypothetical protein